MYVTFSNIVNYESSSGFQTTKLLRKTRRLSGKDIITITTDVDPLLFSEDSMTSTFTSYGLKSKTVQRVKRRLKKSEVVKLSDISDDREYLSDNDEFESRSVEGLLDLNSSFVGSPLIKEDQVDKTIRLNEHEHEKKIHKKRPSHKVKQRCRIDKKPKRRLKRPTIHAPESLRRIAQE